MDRNEAGSQLSRGGDSSLELNSPMPSQALSYYHMNFTTYLRCYRNVGRERHRIRIQAQNPSDRKVKVPGITRACEDSPRFCRNVSFNSGVDVPKAKIPPTTNRSGRPCHMLTVSSPFKASSSSLDTLPVGETALSFSRRAATSCPFLARVIHRLRKNLITCRN